MSCVIEWVITTIDGKKCKANGEKRPQSRGELTIAGLCLLCVCVCVCVYFNKHAYFGRHQGIAFVLSFQLFNFY